MLPWKYSFNLVSRKKAKLISASKVPPVVQIQSIKDSVSQDKEADNNKRTFLKVASVAGAGILASQLLPRKAEALILGSTPSSSVVGVKDSTNVRIDPAKEGGNLLTVKTNTDPLVTSDGGAYVRQDSTATMAKESGGNLAAIKTNSDKFIFDGENLKVTSSGGAASAVGIQNTDSVQVNPATEDSILYLRRIVKLMESQATVDSGNRQRITLDSLGPATAITTTVPVSGSLTTAGTVSTVTTVTTVSAITTMLGQNQQAFQDVARNTFANGIRANLTFS